MKMTLDFDHVALPARDARATHRFYSQVLGLTLTESLSGDDWDGFAWLMMIYADGEGRRLALCAFKGLRRKAERLPMDARHYAFSARSVRELASWKLRLAAAGVAWREEDHGDQRSIYFDDPGANTLEITAPARRRLPAAKARAAAEAGIRSWIAANARVTSRARRGGSGGGSGARPARG